ncbi:MAG: TonB-dependent receptor [Blastomonas sp.]
MRHNMHRFFSSAARIVPVALVMALPAPLLAQESADEEVEENVILVTAQGREENLQDVAVSVQVVSGETLAKEATPDLGALSQQLPAINISKGGASDQLFIRGIGSGFNGGFEQSVGTYVDGIYLGRSRASRAALIDIARIELLKGPQTTFFGNSSIAGAIDVTTQTPDVGGDISGHVSALASFNHGETNFEGAINLPLGDTFAIRFAGRKYDMDGYVKNTFLGTKAGGYDETFLRVAAVWEPSDSFTATMRYTFGDSYQDSPFVKEITNCGSTGPGNPNGRPGTSCAVHASNIDNQLDYRIQYGSPEFSKGKYHIGLLEMTVDTDVMTVTSITGYVNTKNQDLMDLDSGPFYNFVTNQYDQFEQISQELRFASPQGQFIEWLGGLYYQSGDILFDGHQAPYFVGAPPFQAAVTAALANGRFLGANSNRQQDESTMSAFASATLNLSDTFRVAAGLRWIEVKKDADFAIQWATYADGTLDSSTLTPVAPPFPGFVTVGSARRSGKWNDLLPSIDLEWDAADDVMLYASFSQGFKAGGFDFSSRDGNVIPRFEEETVDSWELGIKSLLLDGRLTFNAALFYMEYKGVQQSVLNPADFSFTVSNAAASSTRGVEFDINFEPIDNLVLSANVTIMDAQFDEFLGACSDFQTRTGVCPNGFQDLDGAPTPFAPDYSGLIKATYTVDMGNLALDIAPQLYFSDSYFLQSDLDPFNEQGAYARLDLRIALHDIDENWELAFLGKNLTDEKVVFFSNDLAGSAGSYMIGLNRPRSYAIQARYNF